MISSLFRWFRSRRGTVVNWAAGLAETTGVLTRDQVQLKDVGDPISDCPADGRDFSDKIALVLEIEDTIEYSTRPKSPMAHYDLARKLCAHNDLGLMFSERKDYERALLHFRKAVEADPENAVGARTSWWRCTTRRTTRKPLLIVGAC